MKIIDCSVFSLAHLLYFCPLFIYMVKEFLFVGLGGAVGSMLRYGVTVLARVMSLSSNWGTLLVNVLGSFLIGLVMASCEKGTGFLFLTVGLCGGFTTFSTFSSQSLNLLQEGRFGAAFTYIFGTLLLCLLFVWLGTLLGNGIRTLS